MTWTIHHGDCLDILRTLPDASVDAVIADPPYSSGGAYRGDRNQDVAAKYQQSGTAKTYATFTGDAMDSRSWCYWSTLWLSEVRRIVRPGGYLLCFADWRQLPTLTDAVQSASWVWRGLIAWDKTDAARGPHKGYFRHQCEYVAWGTNGACEVPPVDDPRGGPWPGCFRVPVRQADKHHVTGKPTELMRQLARCVPVGGTILDPFAGSGSTGVGALLEGRQFIGIEREAAYVDIARRRLTEAAAKQATPLLGVPQ